LVDSTTNTEVTTHEFRINAPIGDNASLTAGVFFSDLELRELNLFTYPSSVDNDITYAANYALTDTSVSGSINNASPGWFSAGPFSEPVIFFNDIKRTDKQQGVFGELSIDMSETSELTVGARWYDIEVDFEGSANSSFYNGFGAPDTQQFGSNLSAQYAQEMQMVIQIKLKAMARLVKLLILGIHPKILCITSPGQKVLDQGY
jgi:outer membrane receptor protein involved in Fe transport